MNAEQVRRISQAVWVLGSVLLLVSVALTYGADNGRD